MYGVGVAWYFIIPALFTAMIGGIGGIMAGINAILTYRNAKRAQSGSVLTADAKLTFDSMVTLLKLYQGELVPVVKELTNAAQKIHTAAERIAHREEAGYAHPAK